MPHKARASTYRAQSPSVAQWWDRLGEPTGAEGAIDFGYFLLL
ncbi:hypothetical protein [Streptomyces fructofermentans]